MELDRSLSRTPPSASERSSEDEIEVLTDEELKVRIKETHAVEVGKEGAVWTVSTAKHGNGVMCLLDTANLETYWQSDGALPHVVTVELPALTAVESVCVYLDHTRDESYTPQSFKVKAGTHAGDMIEVATMEMKCPVGWVVTPIGQEFAVTYPERGTGSTPADIAAQLLRDTVALEAAAADERIWCTKLEIVFTANHDNGRDCHVRGIRILGAAVVSAFTDTAFTQQLVLR